jgi:hypothetical protein
MTLPEPWAALAHALGGVSALAEACGVQRLAIYRWAHGERVPGAIVKKHVNALAKRRGISVPWP